MKTKKGVCHFIKYSTFVASIFQHQQFKKLSCLVAIMHYVPLLLCESNNSCLAIEAVQHQSHQIILCSVTQQLKLETYNVYMLLVCSSRMSTCLLCRHRCKMLLKMLCIWTKHKHHHLPSIPTSHRDWFLHSAQWLLWLASRNIPQGSMVDIITACLYGEHCMQPPI